MESFLNKTWTFDTVSGLAPQPPLRYPWGLEAAMRFLAVVLLAAPAAFGSLVTQVNCSATVAGQTTN